MRIALFALTFTAFASVGKVHIKITKERKLDIFIFNIQQISEEIQLTSHKESLDLLKKYGLDADSMVKKVCENIG